MSLYTFFFGNGYKTPTTVSAEDAMTTIKVARILRMAKVHRSGRRGGRRYELRPRNRQEWTMRKGVLR